MALILITEDGTGLPNSNTYLSLADADVYFENIGNTIWPTLSEANRNIALYNATKYLDRKYVDCYRGYKSSTDQALQWPRSGAYDDNGILIDGIPEGLKDAECESAIIWNQDKAILYPPITNGIKSKSEKVGPISESVEYIGGSSETVTITEIEQALTGLLCKESCFTKAF